MRPEQFLVLLLMVAAAAGAVAAAVWAWRRRGHAEGADPLYPPAEITRLAVASLAMNGPGLRSLILRRMANPFRALAPEPGLDLPLVLAAAKRFDSEEEGYWWVLALVTLVLVLVRPPVDQMALVILALVAVALRRRWRVRFKLAPKFTRAAYDPAALRRELGVIDPPPAGDAPVVCHGVADPFVGLGVYRGGWNLGFDVHRPAPGRSAVAALLEAQGMDDAIARAIRRLAIPGLQIDELMFVNGAQSGAVGLQNEPLARPSPDVDEAVMARYRHGADPAARVYRRAVISDWSGELVLSYLFRCLRRGDVLVVEAVQLVLTPASDAYRQVDRLRVLSPLGLVLWYAGAIAAFPADLITAIRTAGRRTLEVLDEALFGGVESRERREIKADPAYNYGALWSLRTHMSGKNYASYFQMADGLQYFRAIDEQVLNAIRDCLEENGVDATAMNAQAVSIQNNTVQITGARDVNLSGVAVGASASARVSRGPVRAALSRAGGRR